MTFVGIACKGDHAEVVFDEGAYSATSVKVRPSTKVTHLHHFDALMTVSGSPNFVRPAEEILPSAAIQTSSFDELVSEAPRWLERSVDSFFAAPGAEQGSGSVYLVGYSHRLGEFAAYRFTPRNPSGIRETFVLQPTPYSLRPPADWLKMIIKGLAKAGFPDDMRAELWQAWMGRPQAPFPESVGDWIALAELAREERSLTGQEFLRVHVTGALRMTTLRRDESTTKVIHRFNDSDPETLERMFMSSLHPIGQWLPCGECDSGKPTVECCFADAVTQPCECGSGELFVDCCLVEPQDVRRDQLWTAPFGL
ncbi:hypothetical protein [Nocardioides pyridinolyticus]